MKKIANKVHHHYKNTFTRTDGKNEPEDHHIAGVVILLLIIIVLLSIIVYIQHQDIKNDQELIETLVLKSANDFSSTQYTFEEFSQIAGEDIRNGEQLYRYLLREDFEDIKPGPTVVYGKQGLGCHNDVFLKTRVCRNTVISYNVEEGPFVRVGVERQVLE